MMLLEDASVLWGMSKLSIVRRIKEGLIPGCYKEKFAHGERWVIPDETEPPELERIGSAGAFSKANYGPYNPDEESPLQYVARTGHLRSTRDISADLGVSSMTVRELYDQAMREGIARVGTHDV